MTYTTLLWSVKDRVGTLTVNRPDKLNALNARVIHELLEAFQSARDDAGVGAVLFTGAGEKAFIAGADIADLAKCDPAEARENSRQGQRLTLFIEEMGKPVIAAINGFALGGGCELAMACTLRIASENARLGQPEVKLGIIAGYGGSQRLPRLVGKGRALELLLSGETIDAAEALRIGLVNRVVKRENLMAEAEAVARKILAVGPIAVKYTIEAMSKGLDRPLADALETESDYFGRCFATEDMKEGTKAFLEKRPAKFQGR